MSSHLNRSGFKGTRMAFAAVMWVTGTIGWLAFDDKMDAAVWFTMSVFVLGIYSTSEVIIKQSVAKIMKPKKETSNGP